MSPTFIFPKVQTSEDSLEKKLIYALHNFCRVQIKANLVSQIQLPVFPTTLHNFSDNLFGKISGLHTLSNNKIWRGRSSEALAKKHNEEANRGEAEMSD